MYENILSIDLTSYENTSNFVNQFVKAMNRKAKMLGLVNTSFLNPHGMTTSVNLSSANDILMLSIYCNKNPLFMKIASSKSYKSCLLEIQDDPEERGVVLEWRKTNKLLEQGWEGIKTGQTQRAGACLVSVRDSIFIVVLNSLNN
jgi:D-alanyl-D-alanine carboxypeptidase (penicillin-binding protein 5/6)